MKILVFGNSDTGRAVATGPTWPELVRRDLAASSGAPVELIDRRFFPLPGSLAYAAKLIDEVHPDLVLLPLNEYTFWGVSVELQIRHRLGARAASTFKSAERRFDRITRGKAGVLGSGNRVARNLARRTVGVRSSATATEVTQTYIEILRLLARVEDIQVVIVSYPLVPSPGLRSERMRSARTQFLNRVRSAAHSHHMASVDGDELVRKAGLPASAASHPDEIHVGEAVHPLYAAEILRLLSGAE